MEKKKRVLTPEQRERLLKQLEKGRATRKRNLEEKKLNLMMSQKLFQLFQKQKQGMKQGMKKLNYYQLLKKRN